MPFGYDPKGPTEKLDYPVDFTPVLMVGELITDVRSTIVPVENGGMTIDGTTGDEVSAADPKIVTPKLLAGISGRRYLLTVEVDTNMGRTDKQERTIVID